MTLILDEQRFELYQSQLVKKEKAVRMSINDSEGESDRSKNASSAETER